MSAALYFYLADLTLRALCVTAAAGIVCAGVRGAAGRHAVWVAVLGVTLAMPAAGLLLPAAFIPAPVQWLVVQPLEWTWAAELALDETSAGWRAWLPLAARVYAAVTAALLLRLVLAWTKLFRLLQQSSPVTVPGLNAVATAQGLTWRIPRIRATAGVRVPQTIGFFRPVIFLPPAWTAWDSWKLRAVLAHEVAHIRRWDWIVVIAASINKSLFWFNPAVWWLERKLAALAEEASDEAAVALTGDAPRYAEILLEFAAAVNGRRLPFGNLAMARTRMGDRIERILSLQNPGRGMLRRANLAAIAALAGVALYLTAAARIEPLLELSHEDFGRRLTVPPPPPPAQPPTPSN